MEYLLHVLILFSIYGILAVSLNLVVGYTGLLSIAHAAFYGIGAYVVAGLLTSFTMNFFLAALVGVLVAMSVGFLVGIVFSKFKGDYYALATLGFCGIVFSIFLNWDAVTNGSLGISGVLRPSLFGFTFSSHFSFFILALIFLAVVYGISHSITASSFGRVLRAIREDEQVVQVFGYRTNHFKLIIFVISAGMAALAGSLYASYITFIDPLSFTIMESIFILVIIIFGGLSDTRGALLGALLLVLLLETLRFVGFPVAAAAQMRQVFYGLVLIGLMLWRPRGILGNYIL